MGIDIKAKATDIVASFCKLIDVIEQCPKNALTTKCLDNVDTLNPPEIAIPPVTPFVGDEELAGDRGCSVCLGFGDEVSAFRGIAEKGMNALTDALDIEAALFGFQSHARVEIGDDGGVGEFCFANLRFDGCMVGALERQSILLFCIGSPS